MKPDLIDRSGESVIRTICNAAWKGSGPGKERELLEEITPIYGDYYLILESVLADARKINAGLAVQESRVLV